MKLPHILLILSVRQFADICLFSTAQYKCTVAEIESEEGCPVGPGFTLSKVYYLTPLLVKNKDKRGLALDGQLKHEDTNLASSSLEGCPVGPGFSISKVFTMTPLLANNRDKWGLALDGKLKDEDTNLASSTVDLVAELPFTLMHPKPEEEPEPPVRTSASQSASPAQDANPQVDTNLIELDTDGTTAGEHDDDIIFEDFARLRLKGETDA